MTKISIMCDQKDTPHWLPVEDWTTFKILLIIWALPVLIPDYIRNLFA